MTEKDAEKYLSSMRVVAHELLIHLTEYNKEQIGGVLDSMSTDAEGWPEVIGHDIRTSVYLEIMGYTVVSQGIIEDSEGGQWELGDDWRCFMQCYLTRRYASKEQSDA